MELINRYSEIGQYGATSTPQRREPHLDRAGLRLGERVALEVQLLQRRQRDNRIGERHELIVGEVQPLQPQQRARRGYELKKSVILKV